MTHLVASEVDLNNLFDNKLLSNGDKVVFERPITLHNPLVVNVDVSFHTCTNDFNTNGNLILDACVVVK